jgi:hypothetical protein
MTNPSLTVLASEGSIMDSTSSPQGCFGTVGSTKLTAGGFDRLTAGKFRAGKLTTGGFDPFDKLRAGKLTTSWSIRNG